MKEPVKKSGEGDQRSALLPEAQSMQFDLKGPSRGGRRTARPTFALAGGLALRHEFSSASLRLKAGLQTSDRRHRRSERGGGSTNGKPLETVGDIAQPRSHPAEAGC